MQLKERTDLSAGEWVEVRSREEILTTLDRQGRLAQLPFMPEMFQYCGKRFRVFKRAHKTCDTVNSTGGRKMQGAVHLEGIRCDGSAHGGCQAACLIFWKEAWLKRVPTDDRQPAQPADRPEKAASGGQPGNTLCSETDVWSGTCAVADSNPEDPTYVCQATQLPAATSLLPWWDIRQYLEDYLSGNVTLGRMLRGLLYAGYYNLIQAGIGLGAPLRWLYDRFQAATRGIPFPRREGKISLGMATPAKTLNLQPGEWVRVKDYTDILATLDRKNKNRGMYFDAEEVPYCGGTYRVRSRVDRIINEQTGKMIHLKTDAVILEGVYCQARYSDRRMFCPRSVFPLWREIWLERVEAAPAAGGGEGVPTVTESSLNPCGSCIKKNPPIPSAPNR